MNFFTTRIKNPLVKSNAFEKIVLITDRDNRKTEEVARDILEAVEDIADNIKDRVWCHNTYLDGYEIKKEIEVLLLIVPAEHQGALETVMLEAISEDSYDKNIVDKVQAFIYDMRIEASRYISTDRLQLKAMLGVTWAVKFPEKVFSLIDEQIRNVQWEKYDVLHDCFGMLIDI